MMLSCFLEQPLKEGYVMSEKQPRDSFGARAILKTESGAMVYYRLAALEEQGIGEISTLPFSVKVILESV
jgi:hypothetical protein